MWNDNALCPQCRMVNDVTLARANGGHCTGCGCNLHDPRALEERRAHDERLERERVVNGLRAMMLDAQAHGATRSDLEGLCSALLDDVYSKSEPLSPEDIEDEDEHDGPSGEYVVEGDAERGHQD